VARRDEFDEERTHGDDDVTPTIRCPNCHRDVYSEADSCPHCGEFLIGDPTPLDSKPKWFVLLGLLGILAVVLVLSGLLGML
jgi:hypothetical protein